MHWTCREGRFFTTGYWSPRCFYLLNGKISQGWPSLDVSCNSILPTLPSYVALRSSYLARWSRTPSCPNTTRRFLAAVMALIQVNHGRKSCRHTTVWDGINAVRLRRVSHGGSSPI